jgi:hypothetical protein
MTPARLLLPALRWDEVHGFQRQWEEIERHLERGSAASSSSAARPARCAT